MGCKPRRGRGRLPLARARVARMKALSRYQLSRLWMLSAAMGAIWGIAAASQAPDQPSAPPPPDQESAPQTDKQSAPQADKQSAPPPPDQQSTPQADKPGAQPSPADAQPSR